LFAPQLRRDLEDECRNGPSKARQGAAIFCVLFPSLFCLTMVSIVLAFATTDSVHPFCVAVIL
jgi:hypothetical protein